MFYGTSQFDPVYIVAQIASIQAVFYITLGALFWLLVGKRETVDQWTAWDRKSTLRRHNVLQAHMLAG